MVAHVMYRVCDSEKRYWTLVCLVQYQHFCYHSVLVWHLQVTYVSLLTYTEWRLGKSSMHTMGYMSVHGRTSLIWYVSDSDLFGRESDSHLYGM